MIRKPFKDIELSTLGLGCMRLPMKDKEHIDYEKAHALMEYAYQNGVNYYDTAHVYQNCDSERCLGQWLVKHPRDSFYIATKFNIGVTTDYETIFAQQLERLQTDHIDFYLIHCLTDGNVDKYIDSGAVEFFQKQKELGKITYLGFSSHASVATLTRFADYHNWDFAQIQLNYFDWVHSTTAEEYAVLESRNIPVMVMEPVRGGRLVTLTPDTQAMLQAAHPDWSMAAWALRFAKCHPKIQVVLSGMNDMAQLDDNLATFSDPAVMSQEDQELVKKAGVLFKKQLTVPCTECRYCTADCPMSIDIPVFLRRYNRYKLEGAWGLHGMENEPSEGKPWDCIGCGACTGHCPQNIDIPKIMAELAEKK